MGSFLYNAVCLLVFLVGVKTIDDEVDLWSTRWFKYEHQVKMFLMFVLLVVLSLFLSIDR
jgi:hypothetical protein